MAEENRLVDSVEVTDDKIHIIHLIDVIDASTVDAFEHVLNYLIENDHHKFVVNLSNVEFISSAGWGVFIGELQRIRENDGDIKISGMNSEVYDVYLLLELDMFIQSYQNVDEALQDFADNILGVQHDTNGIDPFEEPEPDRNGHAPAAASDAGYEDATASAFEPPSLDEAADSDKLEIKDPWFVAEEAEAEDAGQHESATPAEAEGDAPGTGETVEEHAVASAGGGAAEGETQESGGHPDLLALEKAELRDDEEPVDPSRISGDPLLEKIVSVVIAHPAYGPSAIRKMLLNMGLINPSLTRSDIYRRLSEVNLSTRAKRIAFANANAI